MEEEEEEGAICIQQRAAAILEMCPKIRPGYTTYVLLWERARHGT